LRVRTLARYDTASITQSQNTWVAAWQAWLGPEQLQPFAPAGSSVTDAGPRASIAWFSGSDQTRKSPVSTGKSPVFYLGLFLDPTLEPTTTGVYYMVFPMDAAGTPSVASALSMSNVPGLTTIPCAIRDPAGRLLAYSTDTDNKLVTCAIYNTHTPPPSSGLAPQPASVVNLSASDVSDVPPAIAFFTDMHLAPQPCSGGEASDSYDVYQFSFYNKAPYSGTCHCQIDYFGTITITCPVKAGSPVISTATDQTLGQLCGIIDGPIPLPAENIINNILENTESDGGDIVFSTTTTGSTEHDVSMAFTLGIQSQGYASKGVGPAWNIAISGGPTWGWGNGSTTVTSYSKTQESLIQSQTDSDGNLYATEILAQGNFWSKTATLMVAGFRFVDASGAVIVDTLASSPLPAFQAPNIAMFSVVLSDEEASGSFTPYMALPGQFKPGDSSLVYYTPEQIQCTMKALGYPGEDYFQEMLLPNAYNFGTAASPQPFMQFIWSETSQTTDTFQQTQSSFTELGGTWSSEVYAGISGGEGVEIFGFGEAMQMQLLGGFTYSGNCNTTTTTDQSWGIQLEPGNLQGSNQWGPPAVSVTKSKKMTHQQLSDAAINYSFLLLFLPVPSNLPSNHWTKELLTFGPKVPNQAPDFGSNIDPRSACWRITCVVISYTTSSGVTYNYSGSLTPNAAAALRGRQHASRLHTA
jgi:hypothetical protein